MNGERDVAGLRCTQVLDLLPDYVESSLEPGRRAQVEAHLAGCTWCERFGGEYGAAVSALRGRRPEPVPAASRSRLRQRLAREFRTPG